MKKLIGGGLAALAVGLVAAAPAQAQDYRGYLDALDAFGMIDHTNSHSCATWVNDPTVGRACKFSQFNADGEDAILAGNYVCDQLDTGRPVSHIADDFTYSEGLPYDGWKIITAAQARICNSPE